MLLFKYLRHRTEDIHRHRNGRRISGKAPPALQRVRWLLVQAGGIVGDDPWARIRHLEILVRGDLLAIRPNRRPCGL